MMIVVLLVIIVGALLVFNNPFSTTLKKAVGITSSVPTFAFNEQDASGWWAADNYNSKENVTKDYKGDTPKDKLSVASRNIFQSKDTKVDSCFVMYAYYDYSVDTDALLKTKEDYSADSSNLTLNKIGTQTLSINTPEGPKSYALHEYAFTGPDSKQMQRGMSLGYVHLSNGYISINGVCPEGDQIASTVLGMKSISLVK